jgi:hypothetical protein
MPDSIPEQTVTEYHSILDELQRISGEDLSSLRISPEDVKPRIDEAGSQSWEQAGRTSVRTATYGRPGSGGATYSKTRYCDGNLFTRQVNALWNYAQQLRSSSNSELRGKDYWSMSDDELERLGVKYNLRPISITGQGEWYVDRDRVIAGLVKRNQALAAGQQPPNQTINVGTMVGSTIQQGTDRSTASVKYNANVNEARSLIGIMQKALQNVDLPAVPRSQVEADINTISAQLESPHPKPSVITECFQSARTVFEGAAGNLLAMGVAREIAKFLSQG